MGFGEMKKQMGISKYTGYSYEGKPITLTKKPGPPIKQARHNPKWYPEQTKVEAATLYAVTRNWGHTSELSKVPVGTLKKWAQEDWWQNVIGRIVKDKNDELDGALTSIIHECQEQIKNRLQVGDPKVNFKTGDVYYVPLDVRALTMSLAILFDKRQLIRGEATSRSETVSTEKRLEFLKGQFEKFSKAKEIEGEAQEVVEEQPETTETEELNSPPS